MAGVTRGLAATPLVPVRLIPPPQDGGSNVASCATRKRPSWRARRVDGQRLRRLRRITALATLALPLPHTTLTADARPPGAWTIDSVNASSLDSAKRVSLTWTSADAVLAQELKALGDGAVVSAQRDLRRAGCNSVIYPAWLTAADKGVSWRRSRHQAWGWHHPA